MLEDDFTYVLRKALKGHALSPSEAAARSGLAESDVMALLRGRFSATSARQLAPVLELNADALVHHPDYEPEPIASRDARQIDMPFGEGQVNAWLVRGGETHVLFDAGRSTRDLATALGEVALAAAFITHSHDDHIAGIPWLLERGVPVYGPAAIHGIAPVKAGDGVVIENLRITAIELPGHCAGALGYRIEGADVPVCVVGDALFAGSIGGCATPELYQAALRGLREGVFTQPDITTLLPGHGPATTVGEERINNPFPV